MKFYKFRSLGTCDLLRRALHILNTSEIWCSKFWQLNDPMEGLYRSSDNGVAQDAIDEIFREKTKRLIGSLSAPCALWRPLMWGYYANGFKGCAIEIEVNIGKVNEVSYTQDLVCPSGGTVGERVGGILLNKLDAWKEEYEFRHLDVERAGEEKGGNRQFGSVTALYVGRVYPKTFLLAADDPQFSDLLEYQKNLVALVDTAKGMGLPVFEVMMRKGRIKIQEMKSDAPVEE